MAPLLCLGGCCHIHLKGKKAVFMQQPVMNILYGLEPGQAAVMNMVRFIVEDNQLFNIPDNIPQINR